MKKTKRNKQLLESIFSEEEAKTSRFNAVKDWAAANKYGLGATTGVAGLSLAGWAAMRAKLQRDYNRATGEDEKRAIREKIKRLNKLALLGGLGATALTAGATLGGPAAYAAIKGQQATDVTQQPSDATLGGPAAYAAIKGQQATDVTQQPSDATLGEPKSFVGSKESESNVIQQQLSAIQQQLLSKVVPQDQLKKSIKEKMLDQATWYDLFKSKDAILSAVWKGDKMADLRDKFPFLRKFTNQELAAIIPKLVSTYY